jgi:hypothetical protein
MFLLFFVWHGGSAVPSGWAPYFVVWEPYNVLVGLVSFIGVVWLLGCVAFACIHFEQSSAVLGARVQQPAPKPAHTHGQTPSRACQKLPHDKTRPSDLFFFRRSLPQQKTTTRMYFLFTL